MILSSSFEEHASAKIRIKANYISSRLSFILDALIQNHERLLHRTIAKTLFFPDQWISKNQIICVRIDCYIYNHFFFWDVKIFHLTINAKENE